MRKICELAQKFENDSNTNARFRTTEMAGRTKLRSTEKFEKDFNATPRYGISNGANRVAIQVKSVFGRVLESQRRDPTCSIFTAKQRRRFEESRVRFSEREMVGSKVDERRCSKIRVPRLKRFDDAFESKERVKERRSVDNCRERENGPTRESLPYSTDTRNCIARRVCLEIEYRGLFRMRRLVGLVQGWSRPPGFTRFTSCRQATRPLRW